MSDFTQDPVLRLPIAACGVQVRPGEERTVTFVNLLAALGESGSVENFTASVPSRGLELDPGLADGGASLTVTFTVEASYATGQEWSLVYNGITIIAGPVLQARPVGSSTSTTIEVAVDGVGEVTVSPYAVATRFRDMLDVDWTPPPTDGQVFAWDADTSKLIPTTPSAGGGGAIDAVEYDYTVTNPTGTINADLTLHPVDKSGAYISMAADPGRILNVTAPDAATHGHTNLVVLSTGGSFTVRDVVGSPEIPSVELTPGGPQIVYAAFKNVKVGGTPLMLLAADGFNGGGAGAVTSVNGHTGVVSLVAADLTDLVPVARLLAGLDLSMDRSADDLRTAMGAANELVVASGHSGTAYTLVLSDQSKVLELGDSSPITLTIPLNASVAFPTGTVIEVFQIDVGQITVTPDGGVTLFSSNGFKTAAQYSVVRLWNRGADQWVLSGDTAP